MHLSLSFSPSLSLSPFPLFFFLSFWGAGEAGCFEGEDSPPPPQNVNCSQNPAYIHLGVHVEEFQSFQAAADATLNPWHRNNNNYYLRAV